MVSPMDGLENNKKTARERGRFGGYLGVDNCVLSLPEIGEKFLEPWLDGRENTSHAKT